MAALKRLEHLAKDWPAAFGSSLLLLKPFENSQAVALCKAGNGFSLLLERDTLFALAGSRYPYVSEILVHTVVITR
jgi:hypothetical protein